ncbi:MAG: NAD(P)-binding domain-containing protein [Balneolaceae bacterium]|nr:NAD(P)-binding domain-containing protein [Balneolaceae bacterium]
MNISVLGCGWLGLPLASKLIEEDHRVKGSTTTEEKLDTLKSQNIAPFLLTLNPELECDDPENFFNSDLLILNVPPGRRRKNVINFHTSQVESIINHLEKSTIQFVIFASSTSVYPKQGGVMEEEDATAGEATRDSGEALIKAEQMLMAQDNFDTTVVRFGGLYGYDRHPANYLAGKKDVSGGNAPVNLIHRDDCINILMEIINQDVRGEIFNAVSDGHPPKTSITKLSLNRPGLSLPLF